MTDGGIRSAFDDVPPTLERKRTRGSQRARATLSTNLSFLAGRGNLGVIVSASGATLAGKDIDVWPVKAKRFVEENVRGFCEQAGHYIADELLQTMDVHTAARYVLERTNAAEAKAASFRVELVERALLTTATARERAA